MTVKQKIYFKVMQLVKWTLKKTFVVVISIAFATADPLYCLPSTKAVLFHFFYNWLHQVEITMITISLNKTYKI